MKAGRAGLALLLFKILKSFYKLVLQFFLEKAAALLESKSTRLSTAACTFTVRSMRWAFRIRQRLALFPPSLEQARPGSTILTLRLWPRLLRATDHSLDLFCSLIFNRTRYGFGYAGRESGFTGCASGFWAVSTKHGKRRRFKLQISNHSEGKKSSSSFVRAKKSFSLAGIEKINLSRTYPSFSCFGDPKCVIFLKE